MTADSAAALMVENIAMNFAFHETWDIPRPIEQASVSQHALDVEYKECRRRNNNCNR